tara:strand:+ start:105 stop:389 length:285 start_codon:yes stop_codon:yes gene_type:complete
MKRWLLGTLLLVSCHSSEILLQEGYMKAVVTTEYTVDGCPFMIELVETKQLLNPQSLSEEHQKNGLEIWIQYQTTKPYVVDCRKGIPARIINIR